jgi:hypothetical protein
MSADGGEAAGRASMKSWLPSADSVKVAVTVLVSINPSVKLAKANPSALTGFWLAGKKALPSRWTSPMSPDAAARAPVPPPPTPPEADTGPLFTSGKGDAGFFNAGGGPGLASGDGGNCGGAGGGGGRGGGGARGGGSVSGEGLNSAGGDGGAAAGGPGGLGLADGGVGGGGGSSLNGGGGGRGFSGGGGDSGGGGGGGGGSLNTAFASLINFDGQQFGNGGLEIDLVPSAVPEPSAWAMLLIDLAGLSAMGLSAPSKQAPASECVDLNRLELFVAVSSEY